MTSSSDVSTVGAADRTLPEENRSSETARFSAPWRLFWVAWAVRVAYITLAHSYRFRVTEDHFQFGWEMGRVARAMVTGFGFADPFMDVVLHHTGPTAWLPPLYPMLMAGAFKVFGVYSLKSAWVLLVVNSLFSASTAMAVYEIGTRCFGRKVGTWSGWLWALYPAAMQYAVRWVWEMSLTTMLFAWVLVLALRMRGIGEEPDTRDAQTMRRWAAFGALWGLIALSNSTLLLFLPVCGLWILLGARDTRAAIQRAIVSGLVFIAVVAPWMVRNYEAFHAFVPFRSNFGAELYMGNNDGSIGMPWGITIFTQADVRHYAELGELRFVKERGAIAKAWIRSHPKQFLLLSMKRFYYFWVSVPHPMERTPWLEYSRELNYCFLSLSGLLGLAVALWKRTPASGLFAWAFLLLPFTYYFVTAGARFRHPLEPLIAVLAVFLFQSARPRRVSQPAT